jgi:TPR repeat protein
VAYDNGLGVEKDTNEAVKWYRKSAEQGNADAISAIEKSRKMR